MSNQNQSDRSPQNPQNIAQNSSFNSDQGKKSQSFINQPTYNPISKVISSSVISESRDSFHEQGFHKRPLGQDLDVTCFLLAVEVERLHEEYYSWRQRAEYLENQQYDRKLYDHHISEQQNKINELDLSNQQYKIEYSRLNQYIEDLKNQYLSTIKEKDSIIEQLRKQLGQYDIDLQNFKVYKDKLLVFEERYSVIQSELQRIQRVAQERSDQNVELQRKCDSYEIKIRGYEPELQRYAQAYEKKDQEFKDLVQRLTNILQQNDDLQKKNGSLEISFSNLKSVVSQKDNEIEEWRKRHSDTYRNYENLIQVQKNYQEMEIKNNVLTNEIGNLQRLLKQRNDDLETYRQRFTQYEIQITHFKQFEERTIEYENKVTLLTTEVERLNGVLFNRLGEIEQYKQKILDLNNLLSQNQFQISSHSSRISELGEHISRKESTIEQYKDRGDRLEKALQNQELRMQDIENKNLKINDSLRQEIAGLRDKIGVYERNFLNYQNMEEKNKEYELRISSLLQQIDQQKGTISQQMEMVSYLRQFEIRFSEQSDQQILIKQEIERLNSVLKAKLLEVEEWKNRYNTLEIQLSKFRNYEAQIIDLENKCTMFATEIERLNNNLRIKLSEISELRQQNENYIRQLQNPEYLIKLQDMESRLIIAQQSNDALNKQLKDKNGEIESWRNQLYKSNDKIQEQENLLQQLRHQVLSINEYENRIVMLSTEIERLNNNLRKSSEKIQEQENLLQQLRNQILSINEYENRIVMLSTEIERLNNNLRIKLTEVSELRQQNENLQRQLQNPEYKIKQQELESRLIIFQQQNESLNRQLKDTINEYENKIVMMSTEIERLNNNLQNKLNEINDLRSVIENLQRQLQNPEYKLKLQEYESRYMVLQQSYESLSKQLKDKTTENENLRSQYIRYSEQVQQQEKQLPQLKAENLNLNILVKQKQEELESWKLQFNQISIRITQMSSMEVEFNRLQAEINQLRTENQQYKIDYVAKSQLEVKLQDLLLNSVLLFTEIESLRRRVKDKEKEINELRQYSLAQYRN